MLCCGREIVAIFFNPAGGAVTGRFSESGAIDSDTVCRTDLVGIARLVRGPSMSEVYYTFSDAVKGHFQVRGGGLIGPPLYGGPIRPQ